MGSFSVSKSEQVTYGYVVLHSLLHAEAVNLHINIEHAPCATDLIFSFHK